VFKPKDEEPYGRLNPKVKHRAAPSLTSLIHLSYRRRSGYIDNFGGLSRLVELALYLTSGMVLSWRRCAYQLLIFCSYISEAAASLLDSRLNLHIVPKTQLVALSSPVSLYELLLSSVFE
jgi:phosphatidylinositol 4-kinase type 2